ncbi:DUF6695 family protein [Sphingobacterium spiritivorum]|uniref:DUF6695 family protein n=1 Tax=Sphingobacterium spiritivorum TaxID=258 RepID=UPI003DA40DED
MDKTIPEFKDFALILAWPDSTIRGDEAWMMFFKKIGIVKNLNFKVGHTGIVLISAASGELLYYDFGRYISPRGHGRARSKESDPRLAINFKARFDEHGKISNLENIVHHFESMREDMQGFGELYFSVAEDINFDQAKNYADRIVLQGSTPYGAVARGNNNCSRFITRLLFNSSQKYTWLHSINFPETIKSSPISNVVNANHCRSVYSYSPANGLKNFRMSRWQSFLFLLSKLADNVRSKKAALLPDDLIIGGMEYESKPASIPEESQYLGGVGEGAWYAFRVMGNQQIIVSRYTPTGQWEYSVVGVADPALDPEQPFQITYDSHLLTTQVIQHGVKLNIRHVKRLSNSELPFPRTAEQSA